MSSAILNIQRFDPSLESAPYFKEYEFPIEDEEQTWSVLKALRYINEEIEPIAFDFNCRWGACGRCGVMVDGIPRLACWSKIEPGYTYTIEPLPNMNIIKDLVVDNETMHQLFVGTESQLKQKQPMTELKQGQELADLWWDSLKDLNRCRECFACYSACNALTVSNKWEKFIGPGAMAQIAHRWIDTQDESDRVMQAVYSGVFECEQCGNCEMVCPAHIKIMTLNIGLMNAAEAQGFSYPSNGESSPNWPML